MEAAMEVAMETAMEVAMEDMEAMGAMEEVRNCLILYNINITLNLWISNYT